MKKLLIAAVLVFTWCSIRGQGDINDQQKIFFRNERTLAIILNTDGYGISYRQGKRIDFLNKRIIDFDAGTFKDPKEVKLTNQSYTSPGSFVYGKKNFVMYLRGGFGHQRELYKKADLGGVAIRYFYSGGAVISMYKPIYYRILDPSNNYNMIEEKMDVNKLDPSMIYGKASFFKGFDELRFIPGIYAKGGFNFEYSKEDKLIHAIEIGAQVNIFAKDIPIMDNESNKAIYLSLFASYRFGVVLDPTNPDANTVESLFRRKKQ